VSHFLIFESNEDSIPDYLSDCQRHSTPVHIAEGAQFTAEPSEDWKLLFETTCCWRMGAGPSGCFALTQPDRFATGACSFFKLASFQVHKFSTAYGPHSLSLGNLSTVQLGNL
jgi:hypothetical protein